MHIILFAFIALVTTLLIGVPIPFAFFASSIVVVILGGYDPSFLLPYGYAQASSIILVAIPLFILAGGLMERGGIGERLVEVVEVLVGRVRGGLGAVMVISCAIFGAISGSGFATVSCIGSIMLPRMYRAGYPRGHCSALIASAGVLGLLIPPSLTMILYAWVGGTSVLASFLATVTPGVTLVILFSIINLILLRNNKEITVTENYDFLTTLKVFNKKAISATPAIIAPAIILGGIYGGVMTPTEAAAMSCLYAIPVGFFIYKGLTWREFYDTLLNSVNTAGVILIMLLSVMVLSRLYIMENVPQQLMALFSAVSDNPIVILLMLNVFMVLIGMLMDDISAILLCTPILLPIVTQLGVTPVQFAAIIGVNLGMGCITPPCAPFLYLAGRIGGAPVNEMLKTTFALIFFAWIPTLLLATFVPGFSLWLPRLVLGIQ
ncbi:TRAP transporter large permease [Anoxynatronum sibiricum]|uniref:TRAP transporter large permease n=1 Tax=Anoxynatronum sibiricum TaxID=210623 RepID=A0ABU9VP83_9CLOT